MVPTAGRTIELVGLFLGARAKAGQDKVLLLVVVLVILLGRVEGGLRQHWRHDLLAQFGFGLDDGGFGNGGLIRRGEDRGPVALAPVASTIELSQSRDGFFRKNSRTFRQIGEQYDSTSPGGIMARLFGGGKKNSGGGSY